MRKAALLILPFFSIILLSLAVVPVVEKVLPFEKASCDRSPDELADAAKPVFAPGVTFRSSIVRLGCSRRDGFIRRNDSVEPVFYCLFQYQAGMPFSLITVNAK